MILQFSHFNFSKVEPLKPNDVAKIEKEFSLPENKERKAKADESSKTKVKKGTTAYYIVAFVRNVMDVLDRHDKKGFFIVIEAIQSRGYKPLFILPYHFLIQLKSVGLKL
ncbi:hypothetical protein RMATCC62417_14212 [Rhizopus microsporus]|nr:hypothetical protein RMATCC62417_14212 [Rhizopus microsporus]